MRSENVVRARDLPCDGYRRKNLDICSTGERTGHGLPYPVLYGGTAHATGCTGQICLLSSSRSLLTFRDSADLLMCNEHSISTL
jgi:hypothetical protein